MLWNWFWIPYGENCQNNKTRTFFVTDTEELWNIVQQMLQISVHKQNKLGHPSVKLQNKTVLHKSQSHHLFCKVWIARKALCITKQVYIVFWHRFYNIFFRKWRQFNRRRDKLAKWFRNSMKINTSCPFVHQGQKVTLTRPACKKT